MNNYIGYTVRPCRTWEGHVEECANSRADFFGVYGETGDGRTMHIKDFPSRQLAEEARDRLDIDHRLDALVAIETAAGNLICAIYAGADVQEAIDALETLLPEDGRNE